MQYGVSQSIHFTTHLSDNSPMTPRPPSADPNAGGYVGYGAAFDGTWNTPKATQELMTMLAPNMSGDGHPGDFDAKIGFARASDGQEFIGTVRIHVLQSPGFTINVSYYDAGQGDGSAFALLKLVKNSDYQTYLSGPKIVSTPNGMPCKNYDAERYDDTTYYWMCDVVDGAQPGDYKLVFQSSDSWQNVQTTVDLQLTAQEVQ